MKTLIALAIAAVFATGCNTFEGFGKDVKKVGETVENAARR